MKKSRAQNENAKNYFYKEYNWLLDTFRNSNVIVFGKKSAGKDVLFALVIRLMGCLHYANMPYDSNTLLLRSLKQLDVGGNDFNRLVDGTIIKYADPFIPGLHIFISDGAVYFGSQDDAKITDAYPGLSIFIALSRQLGEHHIHVNTQALTRLYKKIREQADTFIKCLRTVDCGRFLLIDAISYDKYEAAESGYLPYIEKDRTSIDYQKLVGANGDIEYHTFYVEKSWLTYDTHYFAKLFLNGNKVLEANKNVEE